MKMLQHSHIMYHLLPSPVCEPLFDYGFCIPLLYQLRDTGEDTLLIKNIVTWQK